MNALRIKFWAMECVYNAIKIQSIMPQSGAKPHCRPVYSMRGHPGLEDAGRF